MASLSFRRQHKWAQENLSTFVDGSLSTKEVNRFKGHVEDCPVCQRDVATLRATKKLLAGLPVVAVPRSFVLPASVVSEQNKYRRTTRMFAVMRTTTVSAAALFLLTFAGSAYLSGSYSLSMASRGADTAAPVVVTAPEEEPPLEAVAAAVPYYTEDTLSTANATEDGKTPDVLLLDDEPIDDSLAEVTGPQAESAVAVAEIATPTIEGMLGAYGGGGIATSSATEGDAGISVDSVTLDEPIVMLPEETLFGSSTESNLGTDGTSVTNQAPNLDTNMEAATNEIEPTRVAEAIAPVTETTRAADLEATSATDDVIEQENSSAQTIVTLRVIAGVLGGILLIALAGLLWFGTARRTI